MNTEVLRVCIDANVLISAFAFGGRPGKIISLALERKFILVTSHVILEEVGRNLVKKLDFTELEVNSFIDSILEIALICKPLGTVKYIDHKQDNLVLETALLGNAHILVTGDKKDLLPLKVFQGIIIELPATFLLRLEDGQTLA